VKLAPDLRESAIPDGDAIFATACTTAPAVASSPTRTGVKLYLVQGYEDWLCGSDAVVATWRMPLHKVVSSGWLEDIGVALGEEERTTHIPYGVEFDHFQMRTDPRLRNPFRVGMLSSTSPVKGTRFAIEALEQVQQKFPDLEAIAFGVSARPPELPSSIDYIENPGRPRLASLYNSLAVFLHSSEYEGWSLPSAEAMACGCALVATDSGGIRDYAKDSETALLVAPRDPEALAARLVDVLSDDALRLRLALAGSQAIKEFTWSRAADRMDALLVMIGPRRQA